MECLSGILSGIGSGIGRLLVDPALNQARYLFCCNSIFEELTDKEAKLKKAQVDINEKIEKEREIHRAIEIEEDVAKWLEDVKKEMADVEELKTKIQEKESSLNGLCPNWCCRYLLGRQAAEKTSILSDLQKRGTFNQFTHPEPLSSDKELPLPSCFSPPFQTTELACNQIIEALTKESTKIVGLHGLGGVGKTTLAKFVGNKLRQQKIFDLVGIATVSQNPNIIDVQSQLVKSLGWEIKEKDEEERANRLRRMFSKSKSSKILLIIDDVWKKLELKEKLGIPIGDGDNCCKILLTTRRKLVCDSLGCDTQISLGTLTPEEGLTLLKKNAGIDVNDSTLNDVSKKVAGECKGLPLALEAVGGALRGKGFEEWNLALHKLQRAKLNAIEGINVDDQDVYGCLKFSYDYLNGQDSKSCFLLCSLFPEDYEIDLETLVMYGVALDWYQAESIEETRGLVRGTIKELKASSLLLDTGNDRSVKMHDIVRDVALWIDSEKYRGISLVGNKKKELPSSCPNLHILRLENTVYGYKVKVPEHFFEGMPALKVVTIIGGAISLKSLEFLTNLQGLQLIDCDVNDASVLGKLKQLQILDLMASHIEIPEKLGDELTRLKLLRVGTSISPITVKKFTKLEEFYGEIKNWKVGGMSSQDSYASLVELNSQPDGSVLCLPADFTFQKLQRYVIRMGNEYFYETLEFRDEIIQKKSLVIRSYPPEATSLVIFSALYQTMEFLCLDGVIGCQNIVPSIDQRGLNKLTHLLVKNCKDVECIMDASQSAHGKSGNPVMLSRLASLDVWRLPELKWIWKAPDQHLSLRTLTKLAVSECNNLRYIFTLSQAPSLMQLEILEVSHCKRLECIVEAKFDHDEREKTVGDGNTKLAFPLLRRLRLERLPKLISFCSENYEANLQHLGEKSRILEVDERSHLHDTISAPLKHGFKNLEELCTHELGIQVVFQLEAIIADAHENKQFACLEELRLKNLGEQQVLCREGPTYTFSLQNLTVLSMLGCTRLRHLLSSTLARNLLQLKCLEIGNCCELEQIIDEDEDEDHLQPVCFPKLERIYIYRCPKLKRVFHISVAPSLQNLFALDMFDNDQLEEVFWHKDGADLMDYNEIVLKLFWFLSLENLPSLTNFWPAGYQIPFPSVTHKVHNCPKLRANSEGEDDSKNYGAESQQTMNEEDTNREGYTDKRCQ